MAARVMLYLNSTDFKGKFGAENGRYLAWQLPNHYEGPHQPAQMGRQQKINQATCGKWQQSPSQGPCGNRGAGQPEAGTC